MGTLFKEAYLKLNNRQKLAVDTIDGPLLVIAGPGTGKTQLLSLRVANILDKTDALEENILCLTFTESAVLEMRKRLDQIIGPSANKITINTYHGFGSDLIRQYPEYFNEAGNLQPSSPLLTIKVLRDITARLTVSSPFKNSSDLSDIKTLISNFKQAAMYPSDINKILKSNTEFIQRMSKQTIKLSADLFKVSPKAIPAFRKLLTDTPQTKPTILSESLESVWNRELESALDQIDAVVKTKPLTAWKSKWLEKNADNNFIPKGQAQIKRLSEFLTIYEMYLQKMNQIERYDFDDMILKSIEALKHYPEMKYNLQEQYQYILLDEYQDTNEAQAELISLLCDNSVNENRPNVMAVGDDDQAIYAFQGGSHSHMLNFYKNYNDVKLITLDTNYRSGQNIIDLNSALSGQIESSLTKQIEGINKKFKSASKHKGKVNLVSLIDQPSEFSWIAENILKTSKKSEYSKIAILSPKYKYLSELAAYLQAKDIPINYERREDVLSDPLINQLTTICRVLIAIKDNNKKLVGNLLSQVLNYEFWQLKTESVWQLSWNSYDTHDDWLSQMLKDKSFRNIALFLIKLSSDSLSQRFDMILDQIIGFSETKINQPGLKSYTSPFYDFYKDNQQLSLRTFSSLLLIREEFLDYAEDTKGPLLVSDFVDFVDNFMESDERIINTSPYIEAEQSVRLMSAYKAKGQEFDTVYMLSAVDKVWGQTAKQRSSFIGLPPNLQYIRNRALDNDDEKLRLIYVALSRAENNIYLSSYQKTNASKETSPLKYFEQINIGKLLPKENQNIMNNVKQPDISKLITFYRSEYKPLLEKADNKQTLLKRLEGYQLSPTDFNTFLNLSHAGPETFYNKVILKYPSPDSTSLSYGNAIHQTLEFLQRFLSANNKLPSIEQLQSEFVKHLKSKHLTNSEFDDLVKDGTESLKVYISKNKHLLSPDDLGEVHFKHEGIVIGDAHLNGNIDKLIVDKVNKKLTIVDYKTGKAHDSWNSSVSMHANRNQLYFYKILVDNSKKFKDYSVSSAYLDFTQVLDQDNLSKLELNFDESEAARVKDLITAVWEHIAALNFPDVSKYNEDIKGIREFEQDLISGKI